jgi:hypothetical protein
LLEFKKKIKISTMALLCEFNFAILFLKAWMMLMDKA